MRFRLATVVSLLAALSLCAFAEDASDLQAKMQSRFGDGKILELRNWYRSDKQSYRADGSLNGNSEQGAWVIYGLMHVDNVLLSKDRLKLTGTRIEVVRVSYHDARDATLTHPAFMKTELPLKIEIQLSSTAPTEAQVFEVLSRVFTTQNQLRPRLPFTIREHLEELFSGHWKRPERRQENVVRTASSGETIYRISPGQVTSPTVVKQVDPRSAGIRGTVVLGAVLTPDGRATDIQVIRPLSPETDRNAVDAVAKWRFQPSTKEGQPVAVYSNFEIKFLN